MSGKEIRFRLEEEYINKLKSIEKKEHCVGKSNVIKLLIDNYYKQKDIDYILKDIRNALVGATLSSREAQKKSTFAVDMLNAMMLSNQEKSYYLSHEKKSFILKRSEENYKKQLDKYKTKKESKK